MSTPDIRAAVQKAIDWIDGATDSDDLAIRACQVVTALRAALAAAPEGEPSDDQLDLVVIAIQALTPHQPDATTHDLHAVDRGREILRQSLARWGRSATPAEVPIPVSERLPGSEDCDAEGRCWWFDGDWKSQQVRYRGAYASHWLPAHALPLPAPQGGEVES